VRVIDPEGNQVGVIPTREALDLAREHSLDLVEVAPDSRPPVCKIMDYGRFVFERDKKAKESRRHKQKTDTKQVKLRPNIGDHDLATKLSMAEAFLREGYQVKLTIMFRKREMRRPENGYELLSRATERLADVARVETPPPPELQGRDLTMVFRPTS
jgi:translation initiation factor IF-3